MTDDPFVARFDESIQPGRGSPSLVALVLGLSAAVPMYLWQGSAPAAIATLMIVGYTGWLWAATARSVASDVDQRAQLRLLSINHPTLRVTRMILDPAFWWSLVFGAAMVAGSLWYVGLRDHMTIGLLAGAWSLIAVCLSYGMSLRCPTTRCRSCGYQLIGQLASEPTSERVRCPECGMRWSRKDLGIEVAREIPNYRRAA